MPRLIQIPAGLILFRPGQECPGFVMIHKGIMRVMLTSENGRKSALSGATGRCLPANLQHAGAWHPLFRRRSGRNGSGDRNPAASRISGQGQPGRQFSRSPIRRGRRSLSDLERLVEDVALIGIPARLAHALLRLIREALIGCSGLLSGWSRSHWSFWAENPTGLDWRRAIADRAGWLLPGLSNFWHQHLRYPALSQLFSQT